MSANVKIPTRGDIANYIQRTTLDGVVLTFRFYYNDRDNAWYVSIADVNGEPILSGIKMVPNFPLTRLTVNTKWPGGRLFVFDARPDPQPPVLADLGVNAELLYRGVG